MMLVDWSDTPIARGCWTLSDKTTGKERAGTWTNDDDDDDDDDDDISCDYTWFKHVSMSKLCTSKHGIKGMAWHGHFQNDSSHQHDQKLLLLLLFLSLLYNFYQPGCSSPHQAWQCMASCRNHKFTNSSRSLPTWNPGHSWRSATSSVQLLIALP